VVTSQRALGGKIHTGWLVSRKPVSTGSNCLAMIEVTSHAILELNNEWYETIPAYRQARFILDDAVPFGSQMGMDFLDRVQDAKLCTYGVSNVLTRVIDLTRAPRLLSTTDPDRERRVTEALQEWHEDIAA
jgi:hypothetical protein